MILYPQDLKLLYISLIIPTIFEVLRIAVGYFLVGPSGKIFTLEKEKSEIQAELATIKSVQLELVRNSKLERKVIKIEKEIDGLKSAQKPKEQKFKYYTRIARIVFYLAIGIYLSSSSVLLISKSVLWPLPWFSSEETLSFYPWFVILIAGGAIRHILRSLIGVVANPAIFP